MTIKLVIKNEKPGAGEPDKTLEFDDLLVTFGNNQTATVPLADARIAPEQGVIINEYEIPVFFNQAKGTILNGKELAQGVRHELSHGDELQFGFYRIAVSLGNAQKGGGENFDLIDAEFELNGNRQNNLEAEETVPDLRSFADILTSLRKEEDQFYFQVVEAEQNKARLPIERDEMTLGWSASNIFTDEKESVALAAAVVRKDWSGVTIYPQGNEPILINGQLLEAGRRLLNGERIIFTRRLSSVTTEETTLVFCEPAALVELNSILPQQLLTDALETSRTPETEAEQRGAVQTTSDKITGTTAKQKSKPKNRRLFGYFTAIEVLIMILATILTAGLTFLLLELS